MIVRLQILNKILENPSNVIKKKNTKTETNSLWEKIDIQRSATQWKECMQYYEEL